MRQEEYRYRNLPIPGGGYVTGFIFHPREKGVFYIRTDIGGVYRFEEREQRWKSLIDHVTMDDLSETFPAAVALDDGHPERLYIACGVNTKPHGKLAVSEDYGDTFRCYEMPMHVHGNLNGRGTGYRLIVDKRDENLLWYASQEAGLWKSANRGARWEKVNAFPEEYLTFVGQTKDGRALFAGCAGVTTARSGRLRGHSVYVSYDSGVTFEKLWQPEDGEIEGVKFAGVVAQRYALDEKYLYVTYSVMGRNAYVHELGYSCDGGSVIGGRVARYPLTPEGRIGQGVEITPKTAPGMADWGVERGDADGMRTEAADRAGLLEYGFSGIDTAQAVPGLVIVSTISKEDGDCIFRSRDYGDTWECILYDLEIGKMAFRTSYLKPQYNGGHSLIHWLTDLKINPFHTEEAWFNTGTGVFRSRNLLAEEVIFEDWSDGIEETVHLNLYSPPKGEVKLIDILGDLGGFAFRELDKPCDNSFADGEGNRYITCINADYSDENPACVVVTPRGNWKGKTKGGLILSKDQCKTFERLPMPFGLSKKLDQTLAGIETPNVNSGWVAMSPDCANIVWSVAEGIHLPADMVVASHDGGRTFVLAKVFDKDGNVKTKGGFKVFSDRTDSRLFYGFGDHSDFYVSTDGGETYRQAAVSVLQGESGLTACPAAGAQMHSAAFPEIDFTLIDCANKTEVRGECGKQGVFYMAVREHGLWKLHFDADAGKAFLQRLGKEGDIFYRLGLGLLREGGSYYEEDKALYVAASIDGSYGFYRSVDDGATFVRLNADGQMYGEINSMEGDSQVYGRFYIATGSRGVLYGEAIEKRRAFMEKKFRFDEQTAVVQTDKGKIRGYFYDDMYIFKGVPYAKAARFHAPEPLKAWDGILQTTSYGYVCPLMEMPKPEGELLVPHRYWVMNEDCQNLNIWTPGLDGEKRPVMVWLHGGGFFAGSAIEQAAYEGENMCKLGQVVVVSVNHRLNILGYCDLSAFGEEYANSGNAGTDDLAAALLWIHHNIAAFGGDPENVVVFGQSGGGAKVTTLLQTPAADGLIAKGVNMSGVIGSTLRDSTGSGENLVRAMMRELGAEDVKTLEKIPYDRLVSAYFKVKPDLERAGEYVGGTPHPNAYYAGEPLANGFRKETAHVPLLVGSVFGEFSSFAPTPYDRRKLTEAEGIAIVEQSLGREDAGKLCRLFQEAYPERNPVDIMTLDFLFRSPEIDYLKLRSRCNDKTWSYLFNLDMPIDGGRTPWHCADIPYFFHNTELAPYTQEEGVTEKVEEAVFGMLMAFAKNGSPAYPSLPEWKACTPEKEYTLVIGKEMAVRENFDHELIPALEKRMGADFAKKMEETEIQH